MSIKKFAVIIAGEGSNHSYYLKIKSLINESGLSQYFFFLGHINQLKMDSVLNLADCLVTPSLYEPFGMINLQAAFLNKTIITTKATGSIDLLSNYPKIKVINTNSSSEITAALTEFLGETDSHLLKNLNFAPYSWRSVATQLISYFKLK